MGSQVQAETSSLGTALAVMMVGVLVSILVIVPVLGWLNHKHSELRVARGLDDHGQTALEAVMTVSAGIAIVGFSVWFLFFSGRARCRPGSVSEPLNSLRVMDEPRRLRIAGIHHITLICQSLDGPPRSTATCWGCGWSSRP